MNNFEKIKAMGIEEMADAFVNITDNFAFCSECMIYGYCEGKLPNCYFAIKQWLEAEIEEVDE